MRTWSIGGVLRRLEEITRPPRPRHSFVDWDTPVDGAEQLARTEAEMDVWESQFECMACGARYGHSGDHECPTLDDYCPNPTEPGLDDDELVAVRGLIQERYDPKERAEYLGPYTADSHLYALNGEQSLHPKTAQILAALADSVWCVEHNGPVVDCYPDCATWAKVYGLEHDCSTCPDGYCSHGITNANIADWFALRNFAGAAASLADGDTQGVSSSQPLSVREDKQRSNPLPDDSVDPQSIFRSGGQMWCMWCN